MGGSAMDASLVAAFGYRKFCLWKILRKKLLSMEA